MKSTRIALAALVAAFFFPLHDAAASIVGSINGRGTIGAATIGGGTINGGADLDGLAPTFDVTFGATSGPSALSDSLTMNGQNLELLASYDAKDISGTNWPGATGGTLAETGTTGTVTSGLAAPFTSSTARAVSYTATGNKTHQSASSTLADIGTEDFVVEAVLQTSTGASGQYITGTYNGTRGWVLYYVNGTGDLSFGVHDGTFGSCSVSVGQRVWLHVVVVVDRNSANSRMIVNGTATVCNLSARTAALTSTENFYIGGQPNAGVGFGGRVASVKVWRCSGGTNCFTGDASFTASADSVAKARLYALTGITPQIAGDPIPRAWSRASVASMSVDNGSGRRVFFVGNNWPRVTDEGYIHESAHTNMILQSSDLAVTWACANCAATGNAVVGPNDGLTFDAETLESYDASGNVEHRLTQAATVTAGTWEFSVWGKAGSQSWMFLKDATIANGAAWFNVSTCARGTAQTGIIVSHVKQYANGWCRMSIRFTGTAAAHSFHIGFTNADNALTYDDGTNASVDVSVWGAQLVNLSFENTGSEALELIETTVGTVTSAQDNLIYQTEGNLVATNGFALEVTAKSPALTSASTLSGGVLAEITNDPGDCSGDCCASLVTPSATSSRGFSMTGWVNSANQFSFYTMNETPTKDGATHVVTSVCADDDFRLYVDGTKIGTDGYGTAPASALDSIYVGNGQNGLFYGGRLPIKRIRIFSEVLPAAPAPIAFDFNPARDGSGPSRLSSSLVVNGATMTTVGYYVGKDATETTLTGSGLASSLSINGANAVTGIAAPFTETAARGFKTDGDITSRFVNGDTTTGNLGATTDAIFEFAACAAPSVAAGLMGKSNTIGAGYYFGFDSSPSIQFGLSDGVNASTYTGGVLGGQSACGHALIYFDHSETAANGCRVYLNGSLAGTCTGNPSAVGAVSNASPITIGGLNTNNYNAFSQIDEVGIFTCTACFAGGATGTAQADAIAAERFARLSGTYASTATAPVPTTFARNGPAYVDIDRDGDGTRRLFKVGPKWMRVARRKETTGGEYLTGYLSEPQSTNLMLQSQTLQTTWTAAGVAVGTDAAVAPDGTTTADALIGDNGSDHYIRQTVTTTAASHTLSFFAKAATGVGNKAVAVYDEIGTYGACWNLSTGAQIGTSFQAGPVPVARSESYGNGWYRFSMTWTATAVGTPFRIYSGDDTTTCTASAQQYVGDNVTADVYVWGVQLEAQNYAMSYIPTTTTSVLRPGDDLQYHASNVPSAPRTMDSVFMSPDHDTLSGEIMCAVGSGGTNYEAVQIASTDIIETTAVNTGVQWDVFDPNSTDYSVGVVGSARVGISTNNIRSSFYGYPGTVDASAAPMTPAGAVYIGQRVAGGGSNQPGGLIGRCRWYGADVGP